MARFNVNCDNVWKEVSGAEFLKIAPLGAYDLDSVRRLAELIREALEVLHSTAPFSPEQRSDLVAKIQKLET